jgi:hypothetical protein
MSPIEFRFLIHNSVVYADESIASATTIWIQISEVRNAYNEGVFQKA